MLKTLSSTFEAIMPRKQLCICIVQLCLFRSVAAVALPVRLKISKSPGAGGKLRTKPDLFQRIMQNDIIRGNTDGWRSLQTSGLFHNLSAEAVTSPDNQTHVEVSGEEMPAWRITPNCAVALSRQTGRPELSGGLHYEDTNFRGLGQRLSCEISQKSRDLFSGSRPLPSYSAFWSECNIGEEHADMSAALSVDTIALHEMGNAAAPSRLSRAGVRFERRGEINRAHAVVTAASEPYSILVNTVSDFVSAKKHDYQLIGAKNSVVLRGQGKVPFLTRVGLDMGVRSVSGSSAAPFTAFSASGMLFLPDIAVSSPFEDATRSYITSLISESLAVGSGVQHIDMTQTVPHIKSFMTVASSWCAGAGCVPSMHFSGSRMQEGGAELGSCFVDKLGAVAAEPKKMGKVFHGFKVDSYLTGLKHASLHPGAFAEVGMHSHFEKPSSPLQFYSEYGISLRAGSLKVQIGINDKSGIRRFRLAAALDTGAPPCV